MGYSFENRFKNADLRLCIDFAFWDRQANSPENPDLGAGS